MGGSFLIRNLTEETLEALGEQAKWADTTREPWLRKIFNSLAAHPGLGDVIIAFAGKSPVHKENPIEGSLTIDMNDLPSVEQLSTEIKKLDLEMAELLNNLMQQRQRATTLRWLVANKAMIELAVRASKK